MRPSHEELSILCAARIRRQKAAVDVKQGADPIPRLFSKAQEIQVKFSNLTTPEVDLLLAIVRDLPSLTEAVRAEQVDERIANLRDANRISDAVLNRIIAETWARHRYHTELLKLLPVQTYSAVEERVEWKYWREAAGLLFLSHNGRTVFPDFQFGPDGQPLSVVQEVVEIFRQHTAYDNWAITEWFMSPCRWLELRAAPASLVQANAAAVSAAARNETTGAA